MKLKKFVIHYNCITKKSALQYTFVLLYYYYNNYFIIIIIIITKMMYTKKDIIGDLIMENTTAEFLRNLKQQLNEINNDINSQLDILCGDFQSMNDLEKSLLRDIRDENIETIIYLNKLEMKGLI